MASSSTYAFFHCHYAFQKLPFFCVTLCVLHALQNATLSHSAEHAAHTGWHKRTGNFEMRSGSERMHTWRRTPSTGRNFQTLIIWITVSKKASCNGSISVNKFFLGFLQYLLGFSKVPVFLCHLVHWHKLLILYEELTTEISSTVFDTTCIRQQRT